MFGSGKSVAVVVVVVTVVEVVGSGSGSGSGRGSVGSSGDNSRRRRVIERGGARRGKKNNSDCGWGCYIMVMMEVVGGVLGSEGGAREVFHQNGQSMYESHNSRCTTLLPHGRWRNERVV